MKKNVDSTWCHNEGTVYVGAIEIYKSAGEPW